MKFYKILILTFFAYILISCGGAEERKAVYLEKAKASIETSNLDKARIELKNVLQIDPKDGEAYYLLGKVLEEQKEYRKAYGMYLKAEKLSPDLLENHAMLGRFYLVLANDSEKAQKKVDLILSKEPDNSYGLLLKAAVMLRSKDTDGAVKIARKITSQDPAYLESVAFLASAYMRDDKITDAISLLDTALENNKNNEKLNRLLVLALLVNKDYKRAEAIYLDFLEANPDSSASYNNLAVFYNKTDDKEKAKAILRASVDNKPNDENRMLTLIEYIRVVEGNEEAIKNLESFVSLNTGLGKLRIILAKLFITNDDKPSAIKVLKKAIGDFSEDATGISARTSLASIYIVDKDYDKAAEVVDDALSISPNDPQVNFLKAKFAVRDKDMEKAIISLRIVTKEIPENIEAFVLLANVYQQEGNEDQARNTLTSAYENNKTNADGLLKLAQYHFKRDITKAEKIIDNYNNIKESDYDGLSVKAAILNENKKHSEAYEITKILKEKYPDKPNGYLQAMLYYGLNNDRAGAVALLEEGYLNVKSNNKILELLTTFQVRQKRFDLAEKRIKAEISSSPNDARLKLLLAKVFMAKNDADSAVVVLNEVIQIKPRIELPYLMLSQIYQSKGKLDAVKAALIKGVANATKSMKIPLSLATKYEEEGSYKKAIKVYQELSKRYPENLIVINNLVSLLSDYGNGTDDLILAKTLAEKLKEKQQPVFLDTLGWMYYKLGDSKKAVQNLAQAVEKEPSINVFNYHLGMAYILAGDKVQAKVFLGKSLANKNVFKERVTAETALKGL